MVYWRRTHHKKVVSYLSLGLNRRKTRCCFWARRSRSAFSSLRRPSTRWRRVWWRMSEGQDRWGSLQAAANLSKRSPQPRVPSPGSLYPHSRPKTKILSTWSNQNRTWCRPKSRSSSPPVQVEYFSWLLFPFHFYFPNIKVWMPFQSLLLTGQE